MPLFNVTVRQHTCTGRSYTDVVQAESWKEALQMAAQRPRPSPTGASPRSAIIRPVTQPLPAPGHFPKDRFGNNPPPDRHLPSGCHLAPFRDRIRPACPALLGADGGQTGQVSSKDRLVSKSLSRGQRQPLQAWSLEGAVGDATSCSLRWDVTPLRAKVMVQPLLCTELWITCADRLVGCVCGIRV
jgi:hypothetical protein